jgi:hypothetical protein
MQPDDVSRITRAFETLTEALAPYVQDALAAAYGAEWRRQAQEGMDASSPSPDAWDAHALLRLMNHNWEAAFHTRLGAMGRTLVGELQAQHSREIAPDLSLSDTFRTLDTIARLLRAVGDDARAQSIQQDALAVMHLQFQQPPAPTAAFEAPHEEPPPHGDATAPLIGEADDLDEEDETETPDDDLEAAPPDEDRRASTAGGGRSWFGRLFHRAAEQDLEPLELRTRLLDKIEHALRRFRSSRPIPFNRITVHILAPKGSDRATYEAAIKELTPPFEQAVRNRLYESGFDLPDTLNVRPHIHARAPRKLEAAFEEAGPIVVDLSQQATQASATVTVLKGKAEKSSYRLRSTGRVNVGRLREVEEDHYGHVIRHNHIAFLDHTDPALDDEDRAVNETVSRRHARIEYDAQAGAFVLSNEQGVTSISRLGLPHPVRVSHQTVPLQDDDKIYLGRACLQFETRRR